MIRFCPPETVSDRRFVTPAAERSDNFQMSAPGYKPPEHNDRMIHMIKNLKNNIVIIELFFAPFYRIHLKYPFRYAIRISSTPRFRKLLRTFAQNFALSFSPTHIPRTSFLPEQSIPIAMYTAFLTI